MSEPTYSLIDSGNFQKLEQVGAYRIVRPSPAAVWRPRLSDSVWQQVDATFVRFSSGKGEWNFHNKNLEKEWQIKIGELGFCIKPTGFGHLGIFPEQQDNWAQLQELIARQVPLKNKSENLSEFRVLNLFAYTGGSSLAAARAGQGVGAQNRAGVEVVHVDASKTSVSWARENATASGLEDAPIRWMVDDVSAFVKREVRRGSAYQGIILDPPSYGRGPKNQMWKIEEHLVPLLNGLRDLVDRQGFFVLMSAHSPGYTPLALKNLLMDFADDSQAAVATSVAGRSGAANPLGCRYHCHEMIVKDMQGKVLPSGASCLLDAFGESE